MSGHLLLHAILWHQYCSFLLLLLLFKTGLSLYGFLFLLPFIWQSSNLIFTFLHWGHLWKELQQPVVNDVDPGTPKDAMFAPILLPWLLYTTSGLCQSGKLLFLEKFLCWQDTLCFITGQVCSKCVQKCNILCGLLNEKPICFFCNLPC